MNIKFLKCRQHINKSILEWKWLRDKILNSFFEKTFLNDTFNYYFPTPVKKNSQEKKHLVEILVNNFLGMYRFLNLCIYNQETVHYIPENNITNLFMNFTVLK